MTSFVPKTVLLTKVLNSLKIDPPPNRTRHSKAICIAQCSIVIMIQFLFAFNSTFLCVRKFFDEGGHRSKYSYIGHRILTSHFTGFQLVAVNSYNLLRVWHPILTCLCHVAPQVVTDSSIIPAKKAYSYHNSASQMFQLMWAK